MSQSIEAFKNAFKIPELKQRIIFTLIMVAIYRLGAHVPTPGIDGSALANAMQRSGQGMLSFYDMFTGGAFQNATVFALGIMPYISASIIIQLLTTVVPSLEKLAKEGAEGQKRITEYTRWGTIGLSIVQSIGVALYLQGLSASSENKFVASPGIGFILMCVISFTTGTAFIMWLGEQISENGVGNGMSLLIFVGIAASVPSAVGSLFSMVSNHEISMVRTGILIGVMIFMVAVVVLVTTGQRRIPVQYPRQVKGRKVYGGARNYLPLRVNQAGVIPIIFASSILLLPSMLLKAVDTTSWPMLLQDFVAGYGLLHNVLYAVCIIFFSFFYTAVTFNPVEIADNMKKYGGVITGVRPGKATAEYLNRVMTRITLVGSLFLASVALLPQIIYNMLDITDWNVASLFGGTSLLIMVGVALDTVKQIEQHLVMRNYDGFMKGRSFRGRR